MKKYTRLTALILVLVTTAMLFAGCDGLNFFKSDEELIRERLDTFMSACNSGDFDGVLDCLDKSSRKTYGAIFNIGSSILSGLTGIGIDVRDVLAIVLGLSAEELFAMDIQNIQMGEDDTATVTVSISFTDPQSGQKVQEDSIELPMIKEGRDWYIYARIDWYSLINELS